jgi:hypothetical protein
MRRLSLLVLWTAIASVWCTLSNPFRADGDIEKIIPEFNEVKRGKSYHNMTPARRDDVPALNQRLPSCGIDAKVKWSAVVGSSVYSTPVIFPSGADGTKQIFLNTFYQYAEVLGSDGFKPWGFPLGFDGSSFQSSPILYDIDGDGTTDVALIDKNANLYWVRLGDFGQYLEDFHIQVPKLKVKKDWADGMDPAFLDSYVLTSMFDNRFEPKQTNPAVRPDDLRGIAKKPLSSGETPPTKRQLHLSRGQPVSEEKSLYEARHWTGRVLMSVDGEGAGEANEEEEREEPIQETIEEQREEQAEPELEPEAEAVPEAEQPESEGTVVSEPEAAEAIGGDDRAEEIKEWEARHEQEREDPDTEPSSGEPNAEYAPPHWDDVYADPINPVDGGDPQQWTDDYTTQKYRHWERRAYFGDDYMMSGYGGWGHNDSSFAFVDAHVLASATLADINHDGDMELIIPISYYFDKEEYRGRSSSLSPTLSPLTSPHLTSDRKRPRL